MRKRQVGESKMSDFYEFISIHDWYTTPKNEPLSELQNGKDPLGVAVTHKLLEAEPMRENLKLFTETRLAYLKKNIALREFESMSDFIDQTPGYNIMYQLMADFYNNQPTTRIDLEDAMFKTGRSADRQIARLLRKKSIIRQSNKKDTRFNVYTPTVLTILVYEFVFVPHFWGSFLTLVKKNKLGLRYNSLAIETIKWHKLHQKIMPKSLQIALNPVIDQSLFAVPDMDFDKVVPIKDQILP